MPVSFCRITNTFKNLRAVSNIYFPRSAGQLQFGYSSLGSAVPVWPPDFSSDSHLSWGLHSVVHAEGWANHPSPRPRPPPPREFSKWQIKQLRREPNRRSTLKASAQVTSANISMAKPSTHDVCRDVWTPPMPKTWVCDCIPGWGTDRRQYPNLPWPHSSQMAEPGGEPRGPILLTTLLSQLPCDLSQVTSPLGPPSAHSHTGYNTTYIAGLWKDQMRCYVELFEGIAWLIRKKSFPALI